MAYERGSREESNFRQTFCVFVVDEEEVFVDGVRRRNYQLGTRKPEAEL